MRYTLDQHAGVAYVTVTDQPVAVTTEVTPSCLLDLDSGGAVVGVELINLRTATTEVLQLLSERPEMADLDDVIDLISFMLTRSSAGNTLVTC